MLPDPDHGKRVQAAVLTQEITPADLRFGISQEDRTKYHCQVDRLIAALTKAIHAETDFKVARVIKAGSFAKYTILRRGEGRKVDVDVAFYLSDKDVDKEDLESLSDQIFKFLVSLYPNKSVEDFEIQKRAATVTFVGTGLDVDVVPVMPASTAFRHRLIYHHLCDFYLEVLDRWHHFLHAPFTWRTHIWRSSRSGVVTQHFGFWRCPRDILAIAARCRIGDSLARILSEEKGRDD